MNIIRQILLAKEVIRSKQILELAESDTRLLKNLDGEIYSLLCVLTKNWRDKEIEDFHENAKILADKFEYYQVTISELEDLAKAAEDCTSKINLLEKG